MPVAVMPAWRVGLVVAVLLLTAGCEDSRPAGQATEGWAARQTGVSARTAGRASSSAAASRGYRDLLEERADDPFAWRRLARRIGGGVLARAALFRAAAAYLQLEDLEGARALWEELAGSGSDVVAVLSGGHLALDAWRRGDVDRARRLLRRIEGRLGTLDGPVPRDGALVLDRGNLFRRLRLLSLRLALFDGEIEAVRREAAACLASGWRGARGSEVAEIFGDARRQQIDPQATGQHLLASLLDDADQLYRWRFPTAARSLWQRACKGRRRSPLLRIRCHMTEAAFERSRRRYRAALARLRKAERDLGRLAPPERRLLDRRLRVERARLLLDRRRSKTARRLLRGLLQEAGERLWQWPPEMGLRFSRTLRAAASGAEEEDLLLAGLEGIARFAPLVARRAPQGVLAENPSELVEEAAAARRRAAALHLAAGSPDKALNLLVEPMAPPPPAVYLRAERYLVGRILEATGRRRAAISAFESVLEPPSISYYVFAALDRLDGLEGRRRDHPIIPLIETLQSTPHDRILAGTDPLRPRLSPEAERVFRDAIDLSAAGDVDLARGTRILAGLVDRRALNEPWYRLWDAVALAEAGRPVEARREALRLSSHLFEQGPASRADMLRQAAFWRLLYPLPSEQVQTLIRRLAPKAHMDAALLAGLILQESQFQPRARSRAGARGFMQLMPSTARWIARRSGHRLRSLDQLYDPQVNLPLGVAYHAWLLERYEGSAVSALAAYNAGPGNAARWHRRWPHLAEDLLLEVIPFRETRRYVRLVLRNAGAYRLVHGL